MIRGILLVALAAIFLDACQKSETLQQDQDSGQIKIGGIDSLRSEVLGESRTVWVHIPESAKDKTRSPVKYPVVYLLDGPEHFQSVVGMIKHLSESNGTTFIPEMVVVAVSNTDRSRDLTPTHVDVDFFTGKKIQYNSGGGDNFLSFIGEELIPYIEKKYPVTSYRTFVGHSFGGLSVINALISKPELFTNYVAIDPSLWWDSQAFADRADSILTIGKYEGKALFIGIANTMPDGMLVGEMQKDTSKSTAHIRSIFRFVDSRDSKGGRLRFKWKYYEDDDHGSVPLITTYDAFRYLFDWYRLRGINQFFSPESKATAADLTSLINNHFKVVSDHLGYPQPPPESMMYSLGYGFFYNEMLDNAGAVFDLNIKNFPANPEGYEARGDCYLAQGDSVNARVLFTKCVDAGGTETVKEKLAALKPH